MYVGIHIVTLLRRQYVTRIEEVDDHTPTAALTAPCRDGQESSEVLMWKQSHQP